MLLNNVKLLSKSVMLVRAVFCHLLLLLGHSGATFEFCRQKFHPFFPVTHFTDNGTNKVSKVGLAKRVVGTKILGLSDVDHHRTFRFCQNERLTLWESRVEAGG